MGACKPEDEWPECPWGCNTREVGGSCYYRELNTNDPMVYLRCDKESSLRFLIDCHGRNGTDEISTCAGKCFWNT